jgi:hypothetical protein
VLLKVRLIEGPATRLHSERIELLEDAARDLGGFNAVAGQRRRAGSSQVLVALLRGFRAPKLGEKHEKKFEP